MKVVINLVCLFIILWYVNLLTTYFTNSFGLFGISPAVIYGWRIFDSFVGQIVVLLSVLTASGILVVINKKEL